MSFLSFCPANIYRPSLGKVRLGRPNPKLVQPLNFYLSRKKIPFYSELHALQRYDARFLILILIYFLKNIKNVFKKTLSNICNMYIIIIHYSWGGKSGIIPLLWSLCWCQRNLFHLVVIDNECLKRFWNFKTQLL